jgi:hypothetical protein
MRTRRNMVTGIAAAVLALSACGIAAGTGGGAPGTHAAAPRAGHAVTDTRFADMRELARVKRDVIRDAGQGARVHQPRMDNPRSTDQGDLARVKTWQANQRSGGR